MGSHVVLLSNLQDQRNSIAILLYHLIKLITHVTKLSYFTNVTRNYVNKICLLDFYFMLILKISNIDQLIRKVLFL